MLEALCGNKNIEKILIFLFVNGKCYGTQLHRALVTPLTPLQKAFNRLEKGGIITSYCEGKTRLYQLNPAYPLISELEQLLKKAYTLLPAHQKKKYYILVEEPKTTSKDRNSQMKVLLSFWEKLLGTSKLTFLAKSRAKEESGWNGQGEAEVITAKEGPYQLLFHEKGTWRGKEGAEVNFSNIFRWSLDLAKGVIALEHLRRGPDQPVFLFHLAPTGKQSLSSVDSHLCEGDTYFGQIRFDPHSFHFNWRVIGPKKNEEIDYYYA